MISFAQAKLAQLIIHSIGGQGDQKTIKLSEHPVDIDADLTAILKSYFLDKFKNLGQKHRFVHEFDLMMNELYAFSSMLFNEEKSFEEVSQAIANFLYAKSGSANIKIGSKLLASLSLKIKMYF